MIIETIYDQLNLYAVEVVADYIRSLPQGEIPGSRSRFGYDDHLLK